MKSLSEPAVYVALLVVLATLIAIEGSARAGLERRLPLAPQELYRKLARSRTSWQVVDVRADLASGYEESHIPGAVPLPGCDLARTTAAARDRIQATMPTVIVTADGEWTGIDRCLARFTAARVLAGGMAAWSAASLPEDSGEYSAPSVKAGGGCL